MLQEDINVDEDVEVDVDEDIEEEVEEPTTDEAIATTFATDVATKAQAVAEGTMSLQDFVEQCTQRIAEVAESAVQGEPLGGVGAINDIPLPTEEEEEEE